MFVEDFRAESEKRRNAVAISNYVTGQNSLHCSCPLLLKSQFFLCKQVTGDMKCPQYADVTIWRTPPFIVLLQSEYNGRANIDTGFQDGTEIRRRDRSSVRHITTEISQLLNAHFLVYLCYKEKLGFFQSYSKEDGFPTLNHL